MRPIVELRRWAAFASGSVEVGDAKKSVSEVAGELKTL